jgi:hypothetical protein
MVASVVRTSWEVGKLSIPQLDRTGWEGIRHLTVGRTSWEGWQAELGRRTPLTPERAPAESPSEILAGAREPQRGYARGQL